MLIVAIVLLVVFAFGGVGYVGPRYGTGYGYAGSGVSLLFALILVLLLLKVI